MEEQLRNTNARWDIFGNRLDSAGMIIGHSFENLRDNFDALGRSAARSRDLIDGEANSRASIIDQLTRSGGRTGGTIGDYTGFPTGFSPPSASRFPTNALP